MGIELLDMRLAQAENRLWELQKELDGLQCAVSEVGRDAGVFSEQLARKRHLSGEAASLANSSVAVGFGRMMGERLGSEFQASVNSCFDGMRRQIDGAIEQVRAEIDDERRRIGMLHEEISAEHERMREASEREAEERRAAAGKDERP